MTQDEIDAIDAAGQSDRLDEFYKPAVLAGIFDMSPANIYQLRQQGIIPHSCSYRTAFQSYLNYFKSKANRRSGSMTEIALVRRSEHDRVKTMLAWYNLKQERKEFIDRETFNETVAPVFTSLKSELVALVRKYPEMQTDVDTILLGIQTNGRKMFEASEKALENYVDEEIGVMDTMEEDVAKKVPELEDDSEDDIPAETEEETMQRLLG